MKFVEDFLEVKPTNLDLKAGRILISVPFFSDLFFKRSVVLITDYEKNSSAGLILNRKSVATVRSVINEIKVDDPLFIGGPVMTNNLFCIHNHQNTKGASKLLPGVFVGFDDMFLALIEHNAIESIRYKFFLGYSGWSPGQLEMEIKNKMWVVGHANLELIFQVPADLLWETAVDYLGDDYKHWLVLPKDISYN